jgi:predicted permease
MPSQPAWRRYLRFWGPDVDSDVDDELQFHLEQLIADYEAKGLTRNEAARAAAERFGDARAIGGALRLHDRQRRTRQRWAEGLGELRQHLRIGARSLRRTPAFSITTILTLALGIGFSTAVFAVAHTLLLLPLPVRDEARLVVLWGKGRDGIVPNYPLDLDDARTFVRSTRTLERAALFGYQGTLTEPVLRDDQIVRMQQAQVSGDFFDLLGTRAYLGRALRPSDDVAGAAPVAVLSYEAWQRYYGSDAHVVGQLLHLHNTGIAYTVVGVAMQGLVFPRRTDFWVPIATMTRPGQERFVAVDLVGRLAAGQTAENVRTELGRFYIRPGTPAWQSGIAAVVEGLRTTILGDARPAILVFASAVVLLLLITCINVGSLMLVRGLARVQELAVRSALGARRRHLVMVVLAEGILLACLGGLLGVAFAAAGLRAFVAFAPEDLPRLAEIRLTGSTLGSAVFITGFALFSFGVAPALSESQVDVQQVLRSATRQGAGRRSRRAMEALVAGQIALALVVLSAAALIGQSLLRLERVKLGLDSSHILVAELSLRLGEYDALTKQIALLDRLVPAIAGIPGVAAVSPVVAAPFSGAAGWDLWPVAEGQTPSDAASNPMLNVDLVGPDYFRALGVSVIQGRALTEADREGTPHVVVMSRSAARHYWPAGDAVGKRITVGSTREPIFTVVGIVEDTRYRDLREPRASIYFPLHQPFFPFAPTTLVVRTIGAPETLVPTLRRVIDATSPGVTLARAEPFEQLLRTPLAQPRLNALLLVVFAVAAVLLAAVGLFGAMSTMVRQRTREIGIRIALGASTRDVQRMVLARGLGVAAIGLLLGCLGAIAANRALASLLYAVSPTDAFTLATMTTLLLLVAAVAIVLPARAATRVDPAIALRADA